jgi:hypothetical protein
LGIPEDEFIRFLRQSSEKGLNMEQTADELDVELKYIEEYAKQYGIPFVSSKRKKASLKHEKKRKKKRKKAKAKKTLSKERKLEMEELKQLGLNKDQIEVCLKKAEEKKTSLIESAEKLGFMQAAKNSKKMASNLHFTYSDIEIEKKRAELEQKLFDFLKVINEGTIRLNESLIEETKLSYEICRILRQILKRLKFSFTIPSEALPWLRKTRQIILNEEGLLIMVYENGDVNSKLLEDYPPSILLTVLEYVIPKLGKLVELYGEKISVRVNFFKRIYQELDNLQRAFETYAEMPSEKERFRRKEIKRILSES